MTAGLDTVGVRVPAHPAARALIAAAGTPLAAPSANPFGYVSPTTAAHVAELLGDAVELVLDGGPCRVGVESTILSLAGDPVILRPGGLPREALEDALGTRLAVAAPGDRPLAPGQLQRHYATRTPLAILDQKAKAAPAGPERIGLLAQGPTHAPGFAAVEVLAPDGARRDRCRAPVRRPPAARRDGTRPHPRRAVRGDGARPRDHGPAAARRGARGLATFRRPPGPAAPPPRPACPA